MGYWSNVKLEGKTVTFTLRKNCEITAAMGTGISEINPSENELITGMSKMNAIKIDNTAPYIDNIKVPSNITRNTHTTGIQFTIKDDYAGIGPIGPEELSDDDLGRNIGVARNKL